MEYRRKKEPDWKDLAPADQSQEIFELDDEFLYDMTNDRIIPKFEFEDRDKEEY